MSRKVGDKFVFGGCCGWCKSRNIGVVSKKGKIVYEKTSFVLGKNFWKY